MMSRPPGQEGPATAAARPEVGSSFVPDPKPVPQSEMLYTTLSYEVEMSKNNDRDILLARASHIGPVHHWLG